MATLIEWNGNEIEIRPELPEWGFTRRELEKLIGGPVVLYSLGDGRLMVVADTTRGPVNIKATKMIVESGRATGRAIVGSVIVGCPGEIL